MIDNINALKTSWYLSPPWGQTIPSVEVNLLERVYLRTNRTFGYCCGMQWKHECWIYSIDCRNEILHATQKQIVIDHGAIANYKKVKPIDIKELEFKRSRQQTNSIWEIKLYKFVGFKQHN
ncbi:DUF1392 family protein [Nostoc flagelliforme FACHB-838]|uniref:DUF1392 family protein n=1 Tax=Nostoc flagelliforme FACHB-838 TaxID=2692904 RepID=A0ABR8E141_9NOSO|nr:DUF1392 family protein [Nostoc flagelliforme]MBD2535419.1 DUF1392 family protein [Nostoc flagelliforme FACHB-838]